MKLNVTEGYFAIYSKLLLLILSQISLKISLMFLYVMICGHGFPNEKKENKRDRKMWKKKKGMIYDLAFIRGHAPFAYAERPSRFRNSALFSHKR